MDIIYVELLNSTKDQKTRSIGIWSTITVPTPLKIQSETVQKNSYLKDNLFLLRLLVLKFFAMI